MKRSGMSQIFWHLVTEDRDLVFFLFAGLMFLASIVTSASIQGWAVFSFNNLTAIIGIFSYFIGAFFYINKHLKAAVNISAQKHIPVVVITGKTSGDAREMLETAKNAITKQTGFKEFKRSEDFFNLSLEDVLFHQPNNLNPKYPDQWKFFIEHIQNGVRQFSNRISGDRVYHLFIFGVGLTALAMSLGAVFGTRSKIIVYQLSDQSSWEPVLDLTHNIRRIKESRQDGYKYISTSLPDQFSLEVAIVVNMASHPATGHVQHFLEEKKLDDVTVVDVNNTYQGNLREDDWAPVVQELFSVYMKIHQKAPTQVHLFLNMPIAMAFGLGVAIGIYNRVTVYCWDGITYNPVFSLNELETVV